MVPDRNSSKRLCVFSKMRPESSYLKNLLELEIGGNTEVKKYEGCSKSLASYFFKNRKMMLERYPAVVI